MFNYNNIGNNNDKFKGGNKDKPHYTDKKDKSWEGNKSFAQNKKAMRIASARLINVKCELKDTEQNAMIDTGAEISFINKKKVPNKCVKKNIAPKSIKLANGENTTVKEVVVENIYLPQYIIWTEINLHVLEGMPEDIIIGFDWLKHNKVLIECENGELRFEQGEEEQLGSITMNFEKEVNKLSNYLELFKRNSPTLGSMKGEPHKIQIKAPFTTVFRFYSIPLKIRSKVKRELENMKKLNIIEKSTSKIISPAFCIEKGNGDIRMVIDYRIVNGNTITEQLPFPTISDVLTYLKTAKFFSNIDLNSGYH